jgi:nicotinate-nucleotide--dimethylbenzimidazole phosphoribosyltransferase
MTIVEAVLGVQAGIAAAMSLADDGLDVLALGHVAWGAEPSSAAMVAALTGALPLEVAAPGDAELVTTALAMMTPSPEPLEVLAALGGAETAVMVGLILGAASLDIPIVLDDHGTSAAALVAARLSPQVAGYLVASQVGTVPAHRRALNALGLAPLFDLGVARGEGTAAALALAMIDGAARLLDASGA